MALQYWHASKPCNMRGKTEKLELKKKQVCGKVRVKEKDSKQEGGVKKKSLVYEGCSDSDFDSYSSSL